MAQGQYVTTFSPHGDRLFIRNNESSSDETYLELVLTDKDFEGFYRGLTEERSHSEKRTTRSIRTSAWLDRLERFTRPLTHPVAIASSVGLAVFLVMATVIADADLRTSLVKTLGGEFTLDDILNRQLGTQTGGTTVDSGVFLSDENAPHKSILHDSDENGVIVEPTANQLAQLELLREYIYLTANVKVEGQLYVFKGKTSMLARNSGGDIGMHELTLQAGFEEAVLIFCHEIVHNNVTGHNIRFIHFAGTLAAELENTLGDIARTSADQLDKRAQKILAAEAQWDKLRGK